MLVLFTTLPLEREQANAVLREEGLSALYMLRRVRWLAALPLLGSGKVDYRSLRALTMQEGQGVQPGRQSAGPVSGRRAGRQHPAGTMRAQGQRDSRFCRRPFPLWCQPRQRRADTSARAAESLHKKAVAVLATVTLCIRARFVRGGLLSSRASAPQSRPIFLLSFLPRFLTLSSGLSLFQAFEFTQQFGLLVRDAGGGQDFDFHQQVAAVAATGVGHAFALEAQQGAALDALGDVQGQRALRPGTSTRWPRAACTKLISQV